MARISVRQKDWSRVDFPAISVTVGDVNVNPTPPTAGTLTITTIQSTGVINIPAGMEWVRIYNAGTTSSGGNAATATVNGTDWAVGRNEPWTAKLDEASQVYKKTPAIAINGNGSMMQVTYAQ